MGEKGFIWASILFFCTLIINGDPWGFAAKPAIK